jgi:predicted O-methyltransferase YrrM
LALPTAIRPFFSARPRACKGKGISVDISADKRRYAEEHLKAAGLNSCVEFVTCDARDFIASFMGMLDFVLIDLWKDLYIPCFDLIHPKLSEGAFVAADNILYPEFFREEMAAYRRHVASQTGFESILLPVDSGIELSRYVGKAM